MLELDGVSKQVGASQHIRDVSLTLERGSLNVLLGPTMSGKTTLMRLMAGLDRPTSGRVCVDGKDVTGKSVKHRDIAMVYQQFINYPALSVYENIASPLRIAGTDRQAIDKKVCEAAELLKLTPYLERTPLNLSGGQQQRTALARALVKGAELVMLDEPLANLDYKLREELRVELPRLFAETGAVLVYATTEPHEALLLGGRTATLHEGTVTQFGKTIDVYNQPMNITTAGIFSDPPLNSLGVNMQASCLFHGKHALGKARNDLADGQYQMAFRAHHASLSASSRHTVSVPVTIGTSEITGSETYIHLRMAGESDWVVLTHGIHRLKNGDVIDLHLDPSRFYLFDANGALSQSPHVSTTQET